MSIIRITYTLLRQVPHHGESSVGVGLLNQQCNVFHLMRDSSVPLKRGFYACYRLFRVNLSWVFIVLRSSSSSGFLNLGLGVKIESHGNVPFRSVGGHPAAEPGVPLRHSRDQRDRRPEAVPLRADVLQRRVAGEQTLDQRDRHRLGRDGHRTTKCEFSIGLTTLKLFQIKLAK